MTHPKGVIEIEYDPIANAAYLYFKHPIAYGEAVRTIEVNQDLFIDFDARGTPLGIDILNAEESLGVAGKPSLDTIVQSVKPQIAAAVQSKPQDAQLYQRVLALLH